MEKKKKEDKYYLPRDISWMYFNRRILQEAMKERVPILERLSFLGIYSNNLDEFFKKNGDDFWWRHKLVGADDFKPADQFPCQNKKTAASQLLQL